MKFKYKQMSNIELKDLVKNINTPPKIKVRAIRELERRKK